ncbi:Rap1a/Tai family immunity protein [Emcibacter sp. SYSU 3D8]|uniref:Rap1a/Tai family immunity protein n=1 Tax=Emcibacter sp. SYSU 3D8 TaxID=3133969 RepID=UPI0031FF0F05
MKIVQAGVVTLALAVMPVSVWGAEENLTRSFTDGNKLHMYCQGSHDICASYITGVADTLFMNGGTTVTGGRNCLPNGVTIFQIKDVVKAFLTAHPEKRHLAAASLVETALAEAFPCPTH